MANYTVVGNTKVVSTANLIKKSITIPAISTAGIAYYTIKVTLNSTYSSTMPTCKDSSGTAVSLTNDTASAAQTEQCTLSNVPYDATVKVVYTRNATYYGYTFTSDNKSFSNTATLTHKVANSTAYTFTQPTLQLWYPALTVPAPTNAKYAVTVTPNATYGGTAPTTASDGSAMSNLTAQKIFYCPYNSTAKVTWTSTLAAKTGYYISTTSAASYTMNEAKTAAAGSSSYVLYKHNVTIPAVSGNLASYTVKVALNTTYQSTMPACTIGGTAVTLTNNTATAAQTGACTITAVPYGAIVTVTYTAKSGYTNPAAATHTVGATTTAYAFPAPTISPNAYTFTVTMTPGAIAQTVTINASSQGKKTFSSSGSFSINYGETWTASVAINTAGQGTSGTLSATSGTISGAYTLTCSAAYMAHRGLYNNGVYDSTQTAADNYANQTWTVSGTTASVSVACDTGNYNGTSAQTGTTNGLAQCALVYNGHYVRLKGTTTANSVIRGKTSTTVAAAIAGKKVYAMNAYTSSDSVYSTISYKQSNGTWVYDKFVSRDGFDVPAGITEVCVGAYIKANTTWDNNGSYVDRTIGVVCPTMTKQSYSRSGYTAFWTGAVYGDTFSVYPTASTGYTVGTVKTSVGTVSSNKASGTITSASVQFSAAKATVNKYTLTIPASTNESYKLALSNSKGETVPTVYTTYTTADTNSFTTARKTQTTVANVPYGTTYTISYIGDNNYYPGANLVGTMGAANTTVTHNAASIIVNTSTETYNARSTNAGGTMSVANETLTFTSATILSYDSANTALKVTTK